MYQVLNNDRNELGKYTSLDKALKAIEEYFQCGIKQDKTDIRYLIGQVGFSYVNHCVFNEVTCIIERY